MKKELFVRINSRVTVTQLKFFKQFALEHNLGEGELHRLLLDDFMKRSSQLKIKK